jgi:hypothetical protein
MPGIIKGDHLSLTFDTFRQQLHPRSYQNLSCNNSMIDNDIIKGTPNPREKVLNPPAITTEDLRKVRGRVKDPEVPDAVTLGTARYLHGDEMCWQKISSSLLPSRNLYVVKKELRNCSAIQCLITSDNGISMRRLALILALLGITGIGTVWGWYLGMFLGRIHQPQNTLPVLFTSSLAVSVFILWHSGVSGLALLAISEMSVICIHGWWRRELQKRFGLFRPEYVGVQ